MEGHHRIEVPLRSGGGKKMKKRRELDALIAHSITKRGIRRAVQSQDKLLSVSTDDPDDYTWMNVESSTRRNSRKKVFFLKCSNVLFGISTALFMTILYWLYFDLQQEVSDYRRKIEEGKFKIQLTIVFYLCKRMQSYISLIFAVSAISKIFPDTLQNWHETTSFLIKNQSSIVGQLNELTESIGLLSSNLSNLQATVSGQRNYGQDDKIVADFGAKLEAIATDIEGVKEHYNRYFELQKTLRQETEIIKASGHYKLATISANTLSSNYTKDVIILNETMNNSFTKLENNLMYINNSLSQTAKILRSEIFAHKIKLDDLLDRSQSVKSHVATLSQNWLDYQKRMLVIKEQLDTIDGKVCTF
ncbi:hypothetical protein KR222_009159 [Zaprionus bogoriensis]|nr:hypothetical protein KR222_009159 [Zaprionus bogoriensis]